MTTAQWRTLTYILGVVFLVLLALVVFLIFTRTASDAGSTPTSSMSADASASPSGITTPTASPTAAPSPTDEASPTATPGPSPTGAVPEARATVRGLGIDDPASPQATPRVIVFTNEGGGDVTVRLMESTGGRVELCLYPGTLADPLGDPACLKTTGSTLTGNQKGKKPFTWTVTLAGVKDGTTPRVDVRVTFASHAPRLQLDDVRFQGIGAEPYDSVSIELAPRSAAGTMRFEARWGDQTGGGGEALPFTAYLEDREGGDRFAEQSGEGTSVELEANIAARQRTEAVLAITAPLVATPTLGDLVLTWP